MLLNQRQRLHVGEEIERVVGAGAVGAEADRHAPALSVGKGEDAADRQLHVGHRVGDHGRSPLRDQLELGVIEPDAVGEQGAWPEQPEPIEVVSGARSVLGEASLDLGHGLGEVDLHGNQVLLSELGDPAQRLLADRVDRVWGKGGPDPPVEPGEVIEAAAGALAQGGGIAVGVDQRGADRRPQPRVAHRPGARLGLPVHVPEQHRPGADHLDAGQPRSPVDVVRSRASPRAARSAPRASASAADRRRSRGTGSSPRACDR